MAVYNSNAGANTSNICGWMKLSHMVDTDNCNFCRVTEQTMMMIVYNNDYSTFQKFRSTIIVNLERLGVFF